MKSLLSPSREQPRPIRSLVTSSTHDEGQLLQPSLTNAPPRGSIEYEVGSGPFSAEPRYKYTGLKPHPDEPEDNSGLTKQSARFAQSHAQRRNASRRTDDEDQSSDASLDSQRTLTSLPAAYSPSRQTFGGDHLPRTRPEKDTRIEVPRDAEFYGRSFADTRISAFSSLWSPASNPGRTEVSLEQLDLLKMNHGLPLMNTQGTPFLIWSNASSYRGSERKWRCDKPARVIPIDSGTDTQPSTSLSPGETSLVSALFPTSPMGFDVMIQYAIDGVHVKCRDEDLERQIHAVRNEMFADREGKVEVKMVIGVLRTQHGKGKTVYPRRVESILIFKDFIQHLMLQVTGAPCSPVARPIPRDQNRTELLRKYAYLSGPRYLPLASIRFTSFITMSSTTPICITTLPPGGASIMAPTVPMTTCRLRSVSSRLFSSWNMIVQSAVAYPASTVTVDTVPKAAWWLVWPQHLQRRPNPPEPKANPNPRP